MGNGLACDSHQEGWEQRVIKEKGYVQYDLYPGRTSEIGRWTLGESRDGESGLAKVGKGYVGIYTDTMVFVLW